MKKCFDAGIIQAFLDGELAGDLQESVARHAADCDACAFALSEAEEETAFAFAALDGEFNALVPTNRLWAKINDSIERENNSVWKTAFANFKNLFASPSVAAFAGLLVVAALFLIARNLKTDESNYISQANNAKQEAASPEKRSESASVSASESDAPKTINAAAKAPSLVKKANDYRVVRASFVKENNPRAANQNASLNAAAPKKPAPEFVSGEETYVKTIATLERTVNSRKDEVLKPSARFSYEKDLAVADDAIARMKTAVKQNPKDEAAKRVLLSSYQNKVDLLSSVAEKSELMASLK